MSSLLLTLYPWIKALHVSAVLAWMAGLFYLPRLFVYHAEQVTPRIPEAEDMFRTMERRLLTAIMTPAMIVTWICGLSLVFTPGIVDWSAAWAWVKAGGVLGMTAFHFWLMARRRDFATGRNRLTGRTYRMMNELPTLLMLAIVFAVIIKF